MLLSRNSSTLQPSGQADATTKRELTMNKIAVILSGCGVFDGAEIQESVITLLEIEQQGASYQCFAPNINQLHVINHLTGDVANGEARNVLVESARIARGNIQDLAKIDVNNFDAIIVPGGFGAAKNLSDFALNGANARVQEDVVSAVQSFKNAEKPIGLICIAPAMAPLLLGEGVVCTIGSDKGAADAITAMGGTHQTCAVDDIVIDNINKLVTTPAYMLAENISQTASGIRKLVKQVISMS